MKILNFFGNILGSILGYGTCMNCHGSFLYKKHDSLNYSYINGLEDSEGEVGFMVCTECLKNSKGLNEGKITHRMEKSGWAETHITLARLAIQKHNLSLTIKS